MFRAAGHCVGELHKEGGGCCGAFLHHHIGQGGLQKYIFGKYFLYKEKNPLISPAPFVFPFI